MPAGSSCVMPSNRPRRAVRADENLSRAEGLRCHAADAVLNVKPLEGRNQVRRTLRAAVIKRGAILFGVREHFSTRVQNLFARNSVLVDIARAEVDVPSIPKVNSEICHQPIYREGVLEALPYSESNISRRTLIPNMPSVPTLASDAEMYSRSLLSSPAEFFGSARQNPRIRPSLTSNRIRNGE